jgi:hypothetical protein
MPITINGTTGIAGVDGSASTPSLQGADSNTGMFFPAADTIAFAEGGVEAMRLDSAGNVGIGTTSPSAKLEVKTNSATDNKIISSNSATNLQLNAFSDGTTALEVGASQPLRFIINTTERMRIDASGNLTLATGSVSTFSGVSGVLANGSTTTLFTAPANGMFLVFAKQNSAGNGGIRAMALVTCGTSSNIVDSIVAASASWSSTGTNLEVRLTNSAGGNLVVAYSYIRLL